MGPLPQLLCPPPSPKHPIRIFVTGPSYLPSPETITSTALPQLHRAGSLATPWATQRNRTQGLPRRLRNLNIGLALHRQTIAADDARPPCTMVNTPRGTVPDAPSLRLSASASSMSRSADIVTYDTCADSHPRRERAWQWRGSLMTRLGSGAEASRQDSALATLPPIAPVVGSKLQGFPQCIVHCVGKSVD
jgi:hypothetical protein